MSSMQDNHFETHIHRQSWLVMPEQSGKTNQMINMILSTFENSESEFHILFCANSILLTNQTHQRVDRSLFGNKGVLHLSTSERANVSKVDEVYFKIMDTKQTVPICVLTMCANHIRWADANTLIDRINQEIQYKRLKFSRINVWVDEADKYSTICEKVKEKQNEYSNLYLFQLTATPFSELPKHCINVIPMDMPRSEQYCGWNNSDLDLRIFDIENSSTLGFANEILLQHKDCIVPGSKWFIPAENTIKSHNEMKDMLCGKFNFTTIIINGNGISVYFPNSRVVIYKKDDDELLPILKNIFNELQLFNYRVAITGYICVGRGITIISQDFQFDFAILSYAPDRCEVSQLAGRLKKNGKSWTNLKNTITFTTMTFNQIATDMEVLSSTLAKIAKEKEDQEGTNILYPEDLHNIIPRTINPETVMDKKYYECKHKIYKISFDELQNICQTDDTIDTLYKKHKKYLFKYIYEFLQKTSDFPVTFKDYNIHKWLVKSKNQYDSYLLNKVYSTNMSCYNSVLVKKKNDIVTNENNDNYITLYFIFYQNQNEVIVSPWNGKLYSTKTI